MIRLSRMGTNTLRRLLRAGHQCDVNEIHPEAVQALVKAHARLTERSLRVCPVCAQGPMVDITLLAALPLDHSLSRSDTS
jgi:6-phosphogluconate dehydrogenase (decarboxylating)